MKLNLLLLAGACFLAKAQTPEILYYKFDNTGTTVSNLALNPPAGAATATVMGNLTLGTNTTCLGNGLVGTGSSSTANHLSTNWNLQLSGSWTMHMKFNNYTSTNTTVYYLLGDQLTGGSSFRLFTNGAPGANNVRLSGNGITNVDIDGVFDTSAGLTDLIIIYDSAQQHIRGYVNGVLTVTQPQANPLNINGANFRLGGYGTSTGMKSGMIIDEFGLFNRAITDAEIASLAGFCTLSTSETVTKQKSQVTVADGHLVTSESKFGDYEILDMSGRLIRKGNSRTNKINIAGLDRGVYLIKTAESSTRFVH